MLRCTHCGKCFDLQKEFDKCPACKIGILVGGNFAKNGKPAIESATESMQQALDRFKINTAKHYDILDEIDLDPPDDFFDSGYIDESELDFLNLDSMIPEHLNCHCHFEPIENYYNGEWHLELSSDDTEIHGFMIQTLSPLKESNTYFEEMFDKFIRTFGIGAIVPVGQRNS